MLLFLVIGGVGLFLLAASLLLDGLFDSLGADGFISGPAVAAFVTAFGFGGAIASYMGFSGGLIVLAGSLSGVVCGLAASFLARAAMNMSTDLTPSVDHMVGLTGVVVSEVPAGGFGEVSVSLGGQPVKLSARSTTAPLPAGSPVRVTAVLSPTAVLVDLEPCGPRV
jgi:membrane-bound ClpP family serine protease